MLNFANDYSEGAHEKVLQRIIDTNMQQLPGYGSDEYSLSAAEKIKTACGDEQAQVWFLMGGTQTNAVVIDALLQQYEGVLTAHTGHIAAHEAGAIEAGRHKVLELPQYDGKISASDLKSYLSVFFADENHEHMVFPGMAYISHPTEYGTLYTKDELVDISSVCREYDIPLYLDGARLGYALACPESDLTLADIAELCDAFYIGGTKVGALCGEAVVFPRGKAPKYFMTRMKQHGALLAKGRLLGVQFDALFTDDLYIKIAAHAINMAEKLKNAFREKGYRFHIDSPTNQIFVVLTDERMTELKDKVSVSFWERIDDGHIVVRFAASWATREEDVDALISIL